MTNQRAIILLSQRLAFHRAAQGLFRPLYLPNFDDEEKDALTKAIEALTEQEPRVLTLEEVKKLQSIRDGAIWLEVFGNGLFPALPEFSNKSLTFFVAIVFDGYRSIFENDWYGKTWRCWTAKPTKEQMEATPWEKAES